MRKIFFTFISCISLVGFAQETTPKEALQYAMDDLNGTARFRAMSGAFGALGGDLSAININPAGSIVFKYNTFSASLTSFNKKNESTYFGSNSKDNDSKLDINQIGAAFVFDNTDENSKWKKLSFAINYENTNNLDNSLFMQGTNPNNSISNYFLQHANFGNNNAPIPLAYLSLQSGETVSSLYDYLGTNFPGEGYDFSGFSAQQAMLAYQGYLFDAFDPEVENSPYISNVPAGGNYYQDNYLKSEGYNGKLTLNFGSNYNDFLSLGMNLNIHFVDYTQSTSVYESNNNVGSTATVVDSFQFDNDLYTYGRGFSFNLGAIAKVTDELRAGLAYESPTWYGLHDELSQTLIVRSSDVDGSYIETLAPDVVNVYPKYHINTPSKWTGSLAYVFGSKGLFSADVSMKNYSNTTFGPKNDRLFRKLNDFMENNLQNTISYNIGGEYKIERVSLRAGYRFEESPYKVDYSMGDLTGYSFGIGYNFGDSRLDASYANSHRKYNAAFISSGMDDAARILNTNNTVSLTYTVIF